MKKIFNLLMVVGFAAAILSSCVNQENDHYFVGYQPIELEAPQADTVIVLNCVDVIDYAFEWSSKRSFIDVSLIFGLAENFIDQEYTGQVEEVHVGTSTSYYLNDLEVDEILSRFSIGIGESTTLYWSVLPMDDSVAWCQEVFTINATRCDLPTNTIAVSAPTQDQVIQLDKEQEDLTVDFTWSCNAVVPDYKLTISDESDLSGGVTVDCGASTEVGESMIYSYTHAQLDEILSEMGYELGQSVTLYFNVSATSTLANPLADSSIVSFEVIRYLPDPDVITLTAPAADSEITLNSDDSEELLTFEWECPSTVVTFKIRLYDQEFSVERLISLAADSGTSYSISHKDFDAILANDFGMVESQRKRLLWSVISSDEDYVSSSEDQYFTVTRLGEPVVFEGFTDSRDGEYYPAKQIELLDGSIMTIMSENLRASVYSDGSDISPTPKDGQFDDAEHNRLVGKYYSWAAATRTDYATAKQADTDGTKIQGVCPDGWHMPSYNEFAALRDLYGADVAGYSLKSEEYWSDTDNEHTNESGLGVVPSGDFWHEGVWDVSEPYAYAPLWTSTPALAGYAYDWQGTPSADVADNATWAILWASGDENKLIFQYKTTVAASENHCCPVRCIKN